MIHQPLTVGIAAGYAAGVALHSLLTPSTTFRRDPRVNDRPLGAHEVTPSMVERAVREGLEKNLSSVYNLTETDIAEIAEVVLGNMTIEGIKLKDWNELHALAGAG